MPRNVASVFEVSDVNFIVWLCDELGYIRLAVNPQRKKAVIVSFPNHWLYDAFADNMCLDIGHKDICECNGYFSTHGGTVNL